MIQWSTDARVFAALMRREVYGLQEIFKEAMLDGLAQCGTQVLILCYLFPAIGMSSTLVGPMFIGSFLAMFFSHGFSIAFKQLFDLRSERVIDYHLTLPLSTSWLMAAYIARAAVQMVIVSIPFMIASVYVFHTASVTLEFKPLIFGLLYSMTMLCFILWYQVASFWYELDWFLDNLWPRRIFFLFLFSCLFFPWSAVDAASPLFGYIFLCNPITYIAEGLRASIMPAHQYLSIKACFIVLSIIIGTGLWTLGISMKRRLDPV